MSDVKVLVGGGSTRIYIDGELSHTALFESERYGREMADYIIAKREFLAKRQDGIAVLRLDLPKRPKLGFWDLMAQ